MSELEIIGADLSTFVRSCRIACMEKGADYDLTFDYPNGIADLQSEAHLALHPFGRMPAMRHDGFVLFEASAICRYIDDTFEGPALVPGERRQAAVMEQWISASNDYVATHLTRNYIIKYAFPQTEDGAPDMEAINEALPKVRDTLKILNGALEDGPYLLGQTPYIADFFLLPILDYVASMPEGADLLGAAPNVARFRDAFSKRASYAATLPDRLRQAA
ncbi:putative glutathione S-transferase [bacterium BMS3Bbin10]|nr:putative glutathione S-transferase [bacterium BMS3Bbin10]